MKKSTKLVMALTAMVIGSTAFAQKQCNLGISLTASSMTINYGDTCFFNFTITNNGPASLMSTDTIYFGPIGAANVFTLIPTSTITSGGSQTFPKAVYLRHAFDTFTVDHQMDFCFKMYDQSTITSGGNPVAVTYTDPVAANDSNCVNNVTFKKKPTTGLFELGGDKEQLTVFPNPATDNVMFNLNLTKAGNVQVAVKDVAGREVMRKDFGRIQAGNTAPLNLDISRLQAGMYFIEMNGEDKRAVGKFTKR